MITSRLDAYISRYGNFVLTTTITTTQLITLPLCACALIVLTSKLKSFMSYVQPVIIYALIFYLLYRRSVLNILRIANFYAIRSRKIVGKRIRNGYRRSVLIANIYYRTLAKEGPLWNVSPPPTLGSISCYILMFSYSNMRPCVAALENTAQMAGL